MADKKRTVLLSENPSDVVKPSLTGKLLKKAKKAILNNAQFQTSGFGGRIISLKRSKKPPVIINWDLKYKRGAGKAIKSEILKGDLRGKTGPRFRIKVKF